MRSSNRRLSLPYRQVKRRGDWGIVAVTDRVAVLKRAVRGVHEVHDELWLLDAKRVVTRRLLAHAVTPTAGWWIAEVEVSDSWLAWTELGPGDDLVQAVDWRLYVAPLDRATLSIGEPRLITSAVNTEMQRPLFGLAGARLVWLSTTWADSETVAASRLLLQRLDAEGEPRELYRSSHGMLRTVSTRGSEVVLSEVPRKGSRWTRLLVLSLTTGKFRAAYEVPSKFGLSHWPAWRNGWLAWAPFPESDSSIPTMVLRTRSGRIYCLRGRGIDWRGTGADPVFVGRYLFYDTCFGEVRALRLSDKTSFPLETGLFRRNIEVVWYGPAGAPDLRHTYYTYCIRSCTTELDKNRTIIRIYHVK